MNYTECAEFLKRKDRYLLLTHDNPDGDTAGSAAALCSALHRLGKTAYLYPNPGFTDRLRRYIDRFIAPADYAPECVIAVDIAEKSLFPKGFEGEAELCMDHHPSNKMYAEYTLLEPEKAACGEAVLQLIKTLGLELTEEEATLLYIAVSTDTGCFQYNNTKADTFTAAAELLKAGADSAEVNLVFFRKVSAGRMKLEGMIYSDMLFFRDGEVSVVVVTKEMLDRCGVRSDELDDLASLAGRAEKARICITVREKEDGLCRISVRTGKGYNANEICAVFGGGGHTAAAGCTIKAEPARAVEMLMDVVNEVCK